MDTADLIVHNGKLATLAPTNAEARAAAVTGGRFTAVGEDADVLKLRGPNTRVIDLGGRRAIPGPNDSPLHLIRGGPGSNLHLGGEGVPSLADALRILQEQARRTPTPQWVRVVGGWTE